MRGVHLSRLTCCPGAGASKRCAHHWGTQAVTGATGVGTRDTTHGVTMGVHCPRHTYLVCVPEDSGRRLAQHPDGKWFGTASSRLLLYGQGSFCTRSPSPAFIRNQHEGSWSTLLHQNPSPATWAARTLTRRRFISKSMPSDSSLRKGNKKKSGALLHPGHVVRVPAGDTGQLAPPARGCIRFTSRATPPCLPRGCCGRYLGA